MEWTQMLYDIGLALAPVVGMALTALIAVLFAYIRQHYTWARETKAVEQAEASLKALVAEAEQTFVEAAKAANEDGKLTPEEAKEIKDKVTLRFYRQLTEEQRKILEAITRDLGGWVSAKVEQFVLEQKSPSVSVPPSPSA